MKETNLYDQDKLPPALARAALTEADWRFLRIVHLAGGYALREQVVALRLRGSADTTYRRLRKLGQLGFLESVDLFANPCTPRIYKLTARALRCLGDRHSHIRRAHSERTVLYKLLRLQFICEQQKAARATLALSAEKKRTLFIESGFCLDLLPSLTVSGAIRQDLDELIGYEDSRLSIYYIDRFYGRAKAQLTRLLDRYRHVIASGGQGLQFALVVPNVDRARVYRYVLAALAQPPASEVRIYRVAWWPFDAQRQALVLRGVKQNVRQIVR